MYSSYTHRYYSLYQPTNPFVGLFPPREHDSSAVAGDFSYSEEGV